MTRLTNPGDTLQLTQSTVNNIVRFADSLYPGHMKTAFYNDFAKVKLNLEEYVAKLRLWRDKFEAMLDARPRKQKLEALSCYLAEFHHARFDDVEIPGQYLLVSPFTPLFQNILFFYVSKRTSKHFFLLNV